jgi:NAD(P)-dependent dehydrogenase (short-subunit alcohol dehydrogenase family)
MSKAGLNALVRHVASGWGRQGVRANAILPGFVLTDENRPYLPEGFEQSALREMFSVRLGRPEDVAAMVALLASDEGAWINGQSIAVDGGCTMR